MKILGKPIAENIFNQLKPQVDELKKNRVTPSIAIILVGNNPRSLSYIKQKDLHAKEIGAQSTVYNFEENVLEEELIKTIEKLNIDNNIHGILIQQPLPKHLDAKKLVERVMPQKEVDGLSDKSPYEFPLVGAIMEILKHIFFVIANEQSSRSNLSNNRHPGLDPGSSEGNFLSWLRSQNIVVVGKGDTGGGPIIKKMRDQGCDIQIIDSKTENTEKLTKNADIIVSAVGKRNLIKPEHLKKGVILIGIGIGRDENGLYGDYNEKEIENIAAFYTPTPGGVGPVNVASLMQNLINAAQKVN